MTGGKNDKRRGRMTRDNQILEHHQEMFEIHFIRHIELIRKVGFYGYKR